jgi:hypothetical protein
MAQQATLQAMYLNSNPFHYGGSDAGTMVAMQQLLSRFMDNGNAGKREVHHHHYPDDEDDRRGSRRGDYDRRYDRRDRDYRDRDYDRRGRRTRTPDKYDRRDRDNRDNRDRDYDRRDRGRRTRTPDRQKNRDKTKKSTDVRSSDNKMVIPKIPGLNEYISDDEEERRRERSPPDRRDERRDERRDDRRDDRRKGDYTDRSEYDHRDRNIDPRKSVEHGNDRHMEQEDLELNKLLDKAKRNLDDVTRKGEPGNNENNRSSDDDKDDEDRGPKKELPSGIRKLRKIYFAQRWIQGIQQIGNMKMFRVNDTKDRMRDFVAIATLSCYDNILLHIHIPINSIVTQQDGDLNFINKGNKGFLANLFGRGNSDEVDTTAKMKVVKLCAKVKAILDGMLALFSKSNISSDDSSDSPRRGSVSNPNYATMIQFCTIIIENEILFPDEYWLPSELMTMEFDQNGALSKMDRQRSRLMIANFVVVRVLLLKMLTPISEQPTDTEQQEMRSKQRRGSSIQTAVINYGKLAAKHVKLIRTIIYFSLLLALRDDSSASDDSEDVSDKASSTSRRSRRRSQKDALQTVEAVQYYIQQQLDNHFDSPDGTVKPNDHHYVQIFTDKSTINTIISLVGVQTMLRYEITLRNLISRVYNAARAKGRIQKDAIRKGLDSSDPYSLRIWHQYKDQAAKEKKQLHRYVDIIRQQLIEKFPHIYLDEDKK